jgi:ketosteroid isomerase-like protein
MNRRLFAALVGAAGVMVAQGDDEIIKVEKSWSAAITSNDQAALGKLLSDSLMYTHASGFVDTKKSYLDSLKGDRKYTSVDYENLKVARHGKDTAILTAKMRIKGTAGGTPFNDLVLLTHVWVKHAGWWQLAAHQTTKIPG